MKLTNGRRPLILLVEDDVCAARGLARMLHDDGFDVERASDGAAAMVRLGQTPLPDALITDLYVPHVDGLTVARFARTQNPSIPAIVVTSHVELVNTRSEPMMPAPTVLAKPLDYDHLTEVLHALLPRRAA